MKNVLKKDIQIKAPIERLRNIIQINSLESQDLDIDLLRQYGVFILRNYLERKFINSLFQSYKILLKDGTITKDKYHRTQVEFDESHPFSKIIENEDYIKLISKLWNGSVGFDFMRIIKKDLSNINPVFLHQDACYNVGRFDSYSTFIPLTKCNLSNGGLQFFPGTHNFGHIGDAGGINPSILPADYPIFEPEVNPGDLIIMHSGTWHQSPEYKDGEDRVYLEVATRSGNDPGARKLLIGEDTRDWILKVSVDDLFIDSREQRVRKLTNKISGKKNT